MRNLLFIIMICVIFAMLSCSGDEADGPAAPAGPTVEELEARVIENCHILEEALVEFMDDNRFGWSPYDIYNETNNLGLTVIDYLPGGQMMENPFTGERTEPVDTMATEPGQTGYYRRYSAGTGYYINGFGETHMIVELSNLEELEWRVITNCLILLDAAERFASLNGGIYACCVDSDTTPEGFTLTDLLPGGERLVNPFTGAREEPTDGAACTPGETGYVPIVIIGGYNMGYVITGVGKTIAVTIFTGAYAPNYTVIEIYNEIVYCTGDYCP